MSDRLFWINLNEGRLWRFRGAVAETPLSRAPPCKSFCLHNFNDLRSAGRRPFGGLVSRRNEPGPARNARQHALSAPWRGGDPGRGITPSGESPERAGGVDASAGQPALSLKTRWSRTVRGAGRAPYTAPSASPCAGSRIAFRFAACARETRLRRTACGLPVRRPAAGALPPYCPPPTALLPTAYCPTAYCRLPAALTPSRRRRRNAGWCRRRPPRRRRRR